MDEDKIFPISTWLRGFTSLGVPLTAIDLLMIPLVLKYRIEAQKESLNG